MEVQLTIEKPDGAHTRRSFTEEPITVGSAVANHVVLEDAELAPHQLIIFREKGEWVIRNLAEGPNIVCDERPLAKDETRLLGHEARITMGAYSLAWCADAVPVGSAKDLARPAVRAADGSLGSAAGEKWNLAASLHEPESPDLAASPMSMNPPGRLEPTEPAGPERLRRPNRAGAHDRASLAGDEATARNTIVPEHEMPVEPVARDALPAGPDPLDLTASGASITDELTSDATWLDEVGSEPVEASASDTGTGREAVDRSAPSLRQDRHRISLPDEGDLEPSVSMGTGRSRVTVHGYRRMRPFRAYPLVVQVTRAPLGHLEPGEEDVDPGLLGEGDAAPSYVRIVPSLPGCVVTPVSARLDLQHGAEGVRFWVTPVAAGRHHDGWVDVTWEGSPPARLEMPCHVVSGAGAALFLLLAVATAALANLPDGIGWNPLPYLSLDRLGSLAAPVTEFIRTCGGVVHVLVGLAAVWLLMALVVWAARRPRRVTFTATQADI